jgi:cytochrome b561
MLILVVVRLVNRRLNPPPALPETVPPVQRWAAKASHILLYASMVAMPLLG